MATNRPTMMAGAEEPATLSGFCQPMAMAMVTGGRDVNPASAARSGYHGSGCCCRVEGVDGLTWRSVWDEWMGRREGW